MQEVKRIQLWSGPRNISTAMMYSFAQRNDTQVVDEPLYAHYLRVTGLPHPGRDEVLQSQEQDGNKVMEVITSGHCDKPILFCKQMTHHLVNIDLEFLASTVNILLIRNPKDVLISYAKVVDQPSLSDIGIQQSFELYEFLQSKKYHCLIVDAEELLRNPERQLTALCTNAGIDFQAAMLSWEAGARKEDGIWAKYWYHNVHRSTGFTPFDKPDRELPPQLEKIYAQAKPYYDFLYQKSLKA